MSLGQGIHWGSTSGGGGTTKTGGPTPAAIRGQWTRMLNEWGMNVDKNITNLMNHYIAGNASLDQFVDAVRKTKEYNKTFAGIKGPGGRMTMTESSYLSQADAYRAGAQAANIKAPTQKELGYLFKNHVSTGEAANRFQAEAQYQKSPGMFDDFNAELKAQGHKAMSHPEAVKFLLGAAQPKYYAVWNAAVTRNAANQAGVTVGGKGAYESLSASDEKYIASLGMGQSDLKQHFSNLYQTLGHALPESQLQGFGLTKSDLTQAEFGGPKQGKINQMLEQIAANTKAKAQGTTQVSTRNLGARAAGGDRAQY